MVYIGVDLHRKTTQVAAVDGEGKLLVNRKVPTSGPDILRVFGEVAAEATPTAVAFEATFGWGWFADLLRDAGIEVHMAHPLAAKDSKGRLLVGVASTVGDAGFERSLALIDAGVDVVVIDTAHGHNQAVAAAVRRLSRETNRVQIVAGNVATYEGARALIDGVACHAVNNPAHAAAPA